MTSGVLTDDRGIKKVNSLAPLGHMSFSIDHLILIHPILQSHNGVLLSIKVRIIFGKRA